MAGKREANPNYRPVEPGQTKSTNPESDDLDALVSSFLAELTDISSEIQQNALPPDTEESPETKQAFAPPPQEPQEPARSESGADLERISNEVESALVELEHSRSNVIPIADRKESGPVRSSAPGGNKKQPAAATTPRERARSTTQVAETYDYQGWAELEALRNKVGSPGLITKRRIVFFALIVTLLAIVLGYFYFFRADRSAPMPEPVAPAQAERIGPQPGGASIKDSADPGPRLETAAKPDSGSRIFRPDSPALQRNRPVETAGESPGAPRTKVQEQNRAQMGVEAAPLPAVLPPPSPQAPAAGFISQVFAGAVIPSGSPSGKVEMTSAGSAPSAPLQQIARGEHQRDIERSSVAGKAEAGSEPAVTALPAEVLVRVPPVYPVAARTQKVTGAVELVAYVDKTGDVIRTEFLGGPALFRGTAEEALLKWRFKPASVSGANIASQVLVRMVFSLK